MQGKITQLLQQVLHELGLDSLQPSVTPTPDPKHGDYATNIAFQLGKELHISPLEAAEKVKERLSNFNETGIQSVTIAHPGFINFTLTQDVLTTTLDTVVKNGQIKPTTLFGKKIMVEFTDPNPFKEFHIGHLYSNTVGESLSRLFEANGAEVRRVNYQGDVGLHVAKSLWGMQQLKSEMPSDSEDITAKAKFLGKAYAFGATKFEEDDSIKAEAIEINKKIYQSLEKDDPHGEEMTLYKKGREWSLSYFESIYQRLMQRSTDKTFDRYYFESEAGPKGLEIVHEYVKKGVFKESQGAIIFPGEEYGLHSRVFINSLGLPTYEAKELGLAVTKYSEYEFDLSVMVTGNEINEYFKVLLKALSLIRPEIAEKTRHISHGMVRLPTGKMSSRTGDVVTGEWLLDEAKSRALSKIDEVRVVKQENNHIIASVADEHVKATDVNDVAELVGVGAVKYALLRQGIGKDIEFSFDESISFEGNSGPYLQYTYVRTRSILEKAADSTIEGHFDHAVSPEERELLRQILLFPEVIAEAAEKLSPSTVATYLFNLAQLFNLFYQKYPILKEEEGVKSFRLALTIAVGKTLQEGLHLLGVQTPERM